MHVVYIIIIIIIRWRGKVAVFKMELWGKGLRVSDAEEVGPKSPISFRELETLTCLGMALSVHRASIYSMNPKRCQQISHICDGRVVYVTDRWLTHTVRLALKKS